MRPADLEAASFASWPAPSRTLAVAHLPLLRAMPLSLLPSFLVQIKSGDTLFPVELERLRVQLAALAAKPSLMAAFATIAVPDDAARVDWVRHPGLFVDALARSLWQTHQIDAYHRAAEELFAALPQGNGAAAGRAPLLIAVIGRGAAATEYPLFAKLRADGFYAHAVDERDAPEVLCGLLAKRAVVAPVPYAHWYVDGAERWTLPQEAGVKSFSFPELAPLTDAVLRTMDTAVKQGWGPELLADRMRELKPAALDSSAVTVDPRMAHLFVTLLTQGSGTQLYSTSFVQAAGVELMRRAQPRTVLLRFAPRRRPASMNDMLEQRGQSLQMDPEGALVDADMALYYAWLALQKQPGGDKASLIALVEDHGQAFLVGPNVTRGVESSSPLTMHQLVEMV